MFVLKAATIKLLERKLTGTLFLWVIFVLPTQAQNVLHLEKKFTSLDSDSSYYLHEWAIPSSIEVLIDDGAIPKNNWNFNKLTGRLSFTPSFHHREFTGKDFIVRFQAYPLVLKRNYRAREAIEIDSSFFENPDSLGKELSTLQSRPAFDESDLQQSGSLSRGIIVGSNQDFSLESGLNFELHGALTEHININASLTDQNIPIQPDGTTQNLREFDKVFIQLDAPNSTVEMGDVDINLEQSTFARLHRRLQGATGNTDSKYGDYRGALSVVRGTYKSLSFDGEDGVQGPYRLTGNNDEEFVIILAGTERVYVNGQRVQRGAENEYIIDYGLGEVFFTGNLLIKDETRIVIEYEYVDQNFNRTLIAGEGGEEFLDGKLQIGATVIRQADGNELLSQRSLTQEDIEILRAAGDDFGNATISGAQIVDESERENYVMYARIDTVLNGETYTIYKHDADLPEAIYRVRFSDVGDDEGSYRRVSGVINGLLYEWVGPGRGNYEPFQELPAPQKQQMVAFNGQYRLADKFSFFGEWAISDYDKNRFSVLDNNDNIDMAYDSGFRLKNVDSPLGIISASLRRRYSGRNFEFFERVRDVEFERKWNITRLEQSRETINEAMLNIAPSTETNIGGEFGFVERDDFLGIRQASSVISNEPGLFSLSYNQDLVRSRDDSLAEEGTWFRHNGILSKDISAGEVIFTPYVNFEQEVRDQHSTITDSLSLPTQRFYDVGPGLRIEFGDVQIDAGIAYRAEKSVLANELKLQATAFEQRYEVTYQPSNNFETTNEIKIRNKKYTEAFAHLGNNNRRGLFIKSVTGYSSKNEFIDGEFFYQANTQRQAILQEIFIEVGSKNGQYVWRDTNEDDVQQVDEFFPELSPNEGAFIRKFLPSDELFPVVFLNIRTFNTFKPFTFFYDEDDDESLLAGVTLRSRVSISENSTTQNLSDIYLVNLQSFQNDSNTVQGSIFWEKELDILQNVDKADFRIGYNQSRALNQRTTESIKTYTDFFYINSALDVGEKFQITLNGMSGENRTISSRLQSRNYNIQTYSINPGANATINRSWNTGFNFTITKKNDRYPAQDVYATLIKFENVNRTYLWKKFQTDIRLELRKTMVDGNSSIYGIYELTEGTGEGTNLIWTLNSTYRVSDLIRFSLNYDGRTVENRPAIHTIKLVMSAIF